MHVTRGPSNLKLCPTQPALCRPEACGGAQTSASDVDAMPAGADAAIFPGHNAPCVRASGRVRTPVCACVCSRCQPPSASELTGTGRLRAHSRSLSSHARTRARTCRMLHSSSGSYVLPASVALLHAACTLWLCYVTFNIRAKLDSSPPGVALQAALALMVPDFGGKFGRSRC